MSTNGVSATKRTREPSEMMSKAYEPSTVVIRSPRLVSWEEWSQGEEEERERTFFSDFRVALACTAQA